MTLKSYLNRASKSLKGEVDLGIVESWNNEHLISLIKNFKPNYSIVRLDRSRHGGGILVYVKSSLCVSSVQSQKDIEVSYS